MVIVVNDDRVGRLTPWLYQMFDDPDPSRSANLFQPITGFKSKILKRSAHSTIHPWAVLPGHKPCFKRSMDNLAMEISLRSKHGRKMRVNHRLDEQAASSGKIPLPW